MKRILMILGLLGILVVSTYAQQGAVRVNIPFKFFAADRELPAGDYNFSAREGRMTIRDAAGRTYVTTVITRVAADNAAKGKTRVTFDEVGDRKYLEAVWPSDSDGYLLHSIKAAHKHATVQSSQ